MKEKNNIEMMAALVCTRICERHRNCDNQELASDICSKCELNTVMPEILKRKRIYISGPITGVANYKEIFSTAAAELREADYDVIDPAEVNSYMPISCTHDEYMSMCYPMIDMCDAIYMLPNWQQSKGACIEYGYAKAKGKEIMQKQE